MAHFAKIDETNTVVDIIKIDDEFETNGQTYINEVLGLEGTWIQTSYNTNANEHANGGTPLRGNYAAIGSTYDPTLDVFLPVKIKPYMVLNTSTYRWEYPVAMPTNIQAGQIPVWNETIMNWEIKLIADLLPTNPNA